MRSLLLSQGMLSGERSPSIPFNVVTMYEDFATGKRAKKGLDFVTEELGHGLEFRHSMWRLDILQDPKLKVLATPALAEADLLIISLRGERQLPAKIYVLIGEWLAVKSDRNRALVALFESTASETDSVVYVRLAHLALENELDLFEQAFSDAEDQEASLKLIWVF